MFQSTPKFNRSRRDSVQGTISAHLSQSFKVWRQRSRHDSGPTAFQNGLRPAIWGIVRPSALGSLVIAQLGARKTLCPSYYPGSRRPSTKQIGLVFRQFSGFAVDGNQNKELVQRQYFGNNYCTRTNSTPTGSHGGTTRPDNVGPIHTIQSDLRTKAVQEKRCYSIDRTTMEWAFWQYRAPLEELPARLGDLERTQLISTTCSPFPEHHLPRLPEEESFDIPPWSTLASASSFHSSASIPLGT